MSLTMKLFFRSEVRMQFRYAGKIPWLLVRGSTLKRLMCFPLE